MSFGGGSGKSPLYVLDGDNRLVLAHNRQSRRRRRRRKKKKTPAKSGMDVIRISSGEEEEEEDSNRQVMIQIGSQEDDEPVLVSPPSSRNSHRGRRRRRTNNSSNIRPPPISGRKRKRGESTVIDLTLDDNIEPVQKKVKTAQCSICLDSEEKGMTKLRCGHHFHKGCVKEWMSGIVKNGERFHTNNARCPVCKRFIESRKHQDINQLVSKTKRVWEDMCRILLKTDYGKTHMNWGTQNLTNLRDVDQDWIFYLCYDCGQLYLGGHKDCEEEMNNEDNSGAREDHLCVDCVNKRSKSNYQSNCRKHGKTFIAFKCRYCCNIANFFCFGTTHFCRTCHNLHNNGKLKVKKCKGPPSCTGNHVKNGRGKESEQCLGCVLCRNNR